MNNWTCEWFRDSNNSVLHFPFLSWFLFLTGFSLCWCITLLGLLLIRPSLLLLPPRYWNSPASPTLLAVLSFALTFEIPPSDLLEPFRMFPLLLLTHFWVKLNKKLEKVVFAWNLAKRQRNNFPIFTSFPSHYYQQYFIEFRLKSPQKYCKKCRFLLKFIC